MLLGVGGFDIFLKANVLVIVANGVEFLFDESLLLGIVGGFAICLGEFCLASPCWPGWNWI